MCSDQSNELESLVLQANVEYHDLIAAEYESDASAEFIFTPKVQRRIEAIVELLCDRTGGDLWVDVGCGMGNVLKFADKYFGRAVGFDVSVGMLRLAQERRLNVSLGNAQALPILSGTVDVVSAFSVLHHLFDPKPALTEIYRVLKPGGYFYSDFDPNGLCLIRQPALRVIYRRVYRWYQRLTSCGLLSEIDQDEELTRLQDLAEYHQNQTLGLDPRQVVRDIGELGFRDVRVYPSFGTLDPARLIQSRAIVSRFSLMVNPLFSVVAQKWVAI